MSQVTPQIVREFLVARYADQLLAIGMKPAEVPDSFDLLLGGVIDSFGVLEMVTALETQFGIRVDMAGLDPDNLTIIGPLSKYVASAAV